MTSAITQATILAACKAQRDEKEAALHQLLSLDLLHEALEDAMVRAREARLKEEELKQHIEARLNLNVQIALLDEAIKDIEEQTEHHSPDNPPSSQVKIEDQV